MRQATSASPPRMMAPPTPTTTPITVLRVCVDMPDAWLLLLLLSARPGVGVVTVLLVMVVGEPSARVLVRVTMTVVGVAFWLSLVEEEEGGSVDEDPESPPVELVPGSCLDDDEEVVGGGGFDE